MIPIGITSNDSVGCLDERRDNDPLLSWLTPYFWFPLTHFHSIVFFGTGNIFQSRNGFEGAVSQVPAVQYSQAVQCSYFLPPENKSGVRSVL